MDLRPDARRGIADRRRDVRTGHPHPRTSRRGTQGRPVSRYRHGDGAGVGPVGLAGPPRHRHDRRDHSAGTCPAHRRSQGKGPRCSEGRHHRPWYCPRKTKPISKICPKKCATPSKVHLVDELGEALALTMRGATLCARAVCCSLTSGLMVVVVGCRPAWPARELQIPGVTQFSAGVQAAPRSLARPVLLYSGHWSWRWYNATSAECASIDPVEPSLG